MGRIEAPASLADAGPARADSPAGCIYHSYNANLSPRTGRFVRPSLRNLLRGPRSGHLLWRWSTLLAGAVVRLQGGWARPSDRLDDHPGRGPAISDQPSVLDPAPHSAPVRWGWGLI